ncbi:MAG: hypothetical protein QOH56_2786 [Pseudonocardiales bacterium]|jgi:hypothetical protein|nr:hypothetical protein [Pseudonocardiales bacterium]
MSGIAHAMPPGPDDLARRVAELEKLVQRLMATNVLNAATIDKGGLQILNGGYFKVIDPNSGRIVAYLGQAGFNSTPADGATQQMITKLSRDDGSLALSVADLNSTPGHTRQQFVGIWDRSGNVIVSDDTNGGAGLARPHLASSGLYSMTTSQWPTSTSATYQNLLLGFHERQNPGMTFAFYIHADAGTTGQFQLTVDGTVVATSPTVTDAFSVWSATYYWPAGWTFGSLPQIGVDGIRLSGAGTIAVQTLLLQGVQSP